MNKLTYNQENRFDACANTEDCCDSRAPLFKALVGYRTSQAKDIQTEKRAGQAYLPIFYFIVERILHALNYKRDDRTHSAVPVGMLK